MLNLGFNSRFTIKQTKMLSELFNNFGVFQPAVNPTTLAALFSGKLKKPLVVRNARLLCYIMDCLSQALLITNIWQSVAERTECFESDQGEPTSRNTLSECEILRGQIRHHPGESHDPAIHRHTEGAQVTLKNSILRIIFSFNK